MKRIILNLLALACMLVLFPVAVFAATPELPACWPKQIGATGSSFIYIETSDARAMSWNCVTSKTVTTICIAGLRTYMPKLPDTAGLTAVAAARAYWNANVTDVKDARLTAACKIAKAAVKPLRP